MLVQKGTNSDRTSADLSIDCQKLSADGKKNDNKVVIILFLSADEKELKSGILSADCRRG